jgi:DNA-binding transcriptional regulator PaaX
MKWCRNPENFEGERWNWEERWYVVVYMATGALQSGTISRSKEQAWLRFGAHLDSVRADYMRLGYRVKKISIKPAWKTKK